MNLVLLFKQNYLCHFPGGPALAGNRLYPFWILVDLKTMEVVVASGL